MKVLIEEGKVVSAQKKKEKEIRKAEYNGQVQQEEQETTQETTQEEKA